MRASFTMSVDTHFGNALQMAVEADLDNPHEQSQVAMFEDMTRIIRQMVEAARVESDRFLEERTARPIEPPGK